MYAVPLFPDLLFPALFPPQGGVGDVADTIDELLGSSESYTTASIIDEVTDYYGGATTSRTQGHQNRVVKLANKVMTEFVSKLLRLKGGYTICTEEFSITTNVVDIPRRAWGGQVIEVGLKSSASSVAVPVQQIDPSQRHNLSGYYLLHDQIYFTWNPTGTVVVSYPFSPGKLVLEERAARILTVDTTAKTAVIDRQKPDSFIDTRYDICSPHHSIMPKCLDYSVTVSNRNLTFTDDIDTVSVGDWVTVARESVIPQIPEPLRELIPQGVAVKLAMSHVDAAAYQMLKGEFNEQLRDVLEDLAERGRQPRPIVNEKSRYRRSTRRFYNG